MAKTLLDEILGARQVKYEELSATEKENLFRMLDIVNKSALTLDKFHDFIRHLRNSVEEELVNEPEFIRLFIFKIENRKQIFLKARLKNYMLLDAFLESPKKAREAVLQNAGAILPK